MAGIFKLIDETKTYLLKQRSLHEISCLTPINYFRSIKHCFMSIKDQILTNCWCIQI